MTYDVQESQSESIQQVRKLIVENITKTHQSEGEAKNTISFITESISRFAFIDVLKECGLNSNIIYNSQFNGKSPKKSPNDEGADLIYSLLKLEIEVKSRNNPEGYFTEKEFNEVVLSKFSKDCRYKFCILYNGYKEEKIIHLYGLANKNEVILINIPYPVPYIKIGNIYIINREEVEEYIKRVYPIVRGKCLYYLRKITRSLNYNISKNVSIDHGMVSCSCNILSHMSSVLNSCLKNMKFSDVTKIDWKFLNEVDATAGRTTSFITSFKSLFHVSSKGNIQGQRNSSTTYKEKLSELNVGDFLVERDLIVVRLWENFYNGCEVCGKSFKEHSLGEIVECNSKRCYGEKRKVERIKFIKAVAGDSSGFIMIIIPHYLLKETRLEEWDIIKFSGCVEGEDVWYSGEGVEKIPRAYCLRLEKWGINLLKLPEEDNIPNPCTKSTENMQKEQLKHDHKIQENNRGENMK